MYDARRVAFVAPAGADAAELIDALADMATVNGATAWLDVIETLRPDVLGSGAGRAIVPAGVLAPFCAPGTPLEHDIGVELRVRPYHVYGEAPDPETPPPVVREETHADLLIYASPTGSLDAQIITPVISIMAVLLGVTENKAARRGTIQVHRITPDWAVVLDIESPAVRFGLVEPLELSTAPVQEQNGEEPGP